jgi:hypothetical protein
MISKLTLSLVLSLLLFSCSHTEKKSSKTYSDQTNSSFEDIERDNAINKYRQLRWENWNKKKKGKIKTIKPKKYTHKKRAKKKKIIPTDPNEQRIEIDQNLAFFCMEKRKDSRFGPEGKCESFTNGILQKCEIKFSWNDRNLTKCVKSKLK